MHYTVESLTNERVTQIGKDPVLLPTGRWVNLIEALGNIPRAGKSLRIDYFGLNLPKRSVLDHITSLAIQSDHFLAITRLRVNPRLLADCIAYHDLNEVMAGDIPRFTGRWLAGEHYMTEAQKRIVERDANRALAKTLAHETRQHFEHTIALLENTRSPLMRFFTMVDQTDPIIAIWRYIYLFRINININLFIDSMSDFFENPDVKGICIDPRIAQLVGLLQDRRAAVAYHEEPATLDAMADASHIGRSVLAAIIEARPMHFADNPQPAAAF
jgi:5'-deoxynucleotidase YfbR-like HD superfamily hydrolase